MHLYARIERGVIAEIIEPAYDEDGNEYPIEVRFVPELAATMVDIAAMAPKPEIGWEYDGEAFHAPGDS